MIDQLHQEQQADMLEIEEMAQAKIREDIMRAVLLGGDYVHALAQGHYDLANEIMHEVSLIINQY